MSEANNTEHIYVTLEQIEDLRDAAHTREQRYDSSLRDECLVVCMADFGLRNVEVRQLKQENFNLNQGELTLPSSIQKDPPTSSTASAATLEIDPQDVFNTERLLRTWFRENDSEWVFPSRSGGHISRNTVRNIITELAVEADIHPYTSEGSRVEASELHPHALRHSLANWMLKDNDTRLIDVRNRLRHNSITTTEQIYEHFQRR